MSKGYDTKCYELAGQFLSDEPQFSDPRYQDELARVIQDAIEDQIGWWKADPDERVQP